MEIFKSKQQKFEQGLEMKLCGNGLYHTKRVKYLGVKINTNLNWEHYVKDLFIKLNRANTLLFKMRKYDSLKILRSIYCAIFDSYLSYCRLAWAKNPKMSLNKIQKKLKYAILKDVPPNKIKIVVSYF